MPPTPTRRRQPARRAKAPRGPADAQRARTDPPAPPSGGTQADEGGAALTSYHDASDDVALDGVPKSWQPGCSAATAAVVAAAAVMMVTAAAVMMETAMATATAASNVAGPDGSSAQHSRRGC